MEHRISELYSSIITSIFTFILGYLCKFAYETFFTSKVKIHEFIYYNEEEHIFYIIVENKGKWKIWDMYDLHLQITYYENINGEYKPIRNGEITHGKLSAKEVSNLNVMPKNKIDFNMYSYTYKLGVILVYKNRFNKTLIVEQECIRNNTPIIKNIEV